MALAVEAAPIPEHCECRRQAQQDVVLVEVPRSFERKSEVVVLGRDALVRDALVRSRIVAFPSGLGVSEAVVDVTQAELTCGAAFGEPLDRVLANRLQHPEALVRVAHEALVDERLQRVEIGTGDVLGGIERAPAAEDGQVCEQVLLVRIEQLVGPLDRRAQRLLARVCVPPALEHVEPRREALEDLGG